MVNESSPRKAAGRSRTYNHVNPRQGQVYVAIQGEDLLVIIQSSTYTFSSKLRAWNVSLQLAKTAVRPRVKKPVVEKAPLNSELVI